MCDDRANSSMVSAAGAERSSSRKARSRRRRALPLDAHTTRTLRTTRARKRTHAMLDSASAEGKWPLPALRRPRLRSHALTRLKPLCTSQQNCAVSVAAAGSLARAALGCAACRG
eukprot:3502767-Pleurochrysis_carterae.AAC.4